MWPIIQLDNFALLGYVFFCLPCLCCWLPQEQHGKILSSLAINQFLTTVIRWEKGTKNYGSIKSKDKKTVI